MNKKVILPILFLLCITTLSAQTYERIISLAPSITQNLYYLGAQNKLVGRTSYCVAAENDDIPVVASAVSLNIEKAVALKPDLVLVLGLTDPKDIAALRKFNIEVKVFDSPHSFEDICNQFIEIGDMLNKSATARQIVAESKRKVKDMQEKHKNKPTPKIFFQLGANPLFTVLPNTFMDDFITIMGGTNISNELSKGIIGREFVVAKNPDYIFICSMGTVTDEEIKIWKNYASMSAVKKNHLFAIDADIACQPTPITFIQTLEVMDKAMRQK